MMFPDMARQELFLHACEDTIGTFVTALGVIHMLVKLQGLGIRIQPGRTKFTLETQFGFFVNFLVLFHV